MLSLVTLLLIQSPPIAPFAVELRAAVQSGNQQRVERMFRNASDTNYLFRMAKDTGGLRNLKVAVIPSPPGWEASGKYWAVIHTYQDIEEHHDTVYPVVETGNVWKLGPEIPEDATVGTSIKHESLDVRLFPASSKVQVRAEVDLEVKASTRAPLFRLNDIYSLGDVTIGGTASSVVTAGDTIPAPTPGSVVRAGSLLIPWSKSIGPKMTLSYTGTVNTPSSDKISDKAAYLTAWWTPSIGRLPHTTTTRVVGPADWVLQSEGVPISPEDWKVSGASAPREGEQVRAWRCDIPISYPKVIGGKYVLAAQKTVGSRAFRAYQFEPVDKERAEKDVQNAAAAVGWYEERLAPFPFNEYNCFDADTYYGIESYNYTLLNSRITTWAVGHEAGHTYFGGLVPSAYVNDSWNESMTQYVDSVLRQNNADKTLEGAYQSINLNVPLTSMPVAHEYNSATYYRGAFVLRMLENQIGTPAMYAAIKQLIAERRGKDTTWYDLRPYFEKSANTKLDWFWRQWVSSATFPTLSISDAQGIPHPTGTKVFVTVRQSGTAAPYRVRFRVWTRSNNGTEESKVVEMSSPEAVFELNLGKNKAYEAGIDTFGYVLTPQVKPVAVKF